MPSLKMNVVAMQEAYRNCIEDAANELLDEYLDQIAFGMNTTDGRNDLEKKNNDDFIVLRRQVVAGAWAVMDAFGTGSLMDSFNPALSEYMASSLYNPLRGANNGAITGRAAGSYTNIFGEQKTSTGRSKGRNLENVYVDGEQLFEPIEPSLAFEKAWLWMQSTNRIGKKLTEAVSIFVREVSSNSSRYFIYG